MHETSTVRQILSGRTPSQPMPGTDTEMHPVRRAARIVQQEWLTSPSSSSWGGNDISQERQGAADLIIDLISERAHQSLLPKGTKTWHKGHCETTIDLVLTSEELASTMVTCAIYTTEHRSDHKAIETTFDVATPDRVTEQRLPFQEWTMDRHQGQD